MLLVLAAVAPPVLLLLLLLAELPLILPLGAAPAGSAAVGAGAVGFLVPCPPRVAPTGPPWGPPLATNVADGAAEAVELLLSRVPAATIQTPNALASRDGPKGLGLARVLTINAKRHTRCVILVR